jgi:putative PIN family toxin of toxin-antitoxin system
VLRVTADTNVIVSGLNFLGNPRRLLAAADAGLIRLCVSSAILAEVADVLQRKKFGWSAAEAKEATDWLSRISDNVERTQPVNVIHDDPSDNRILECAAAAKSDYVISGDKHLLRLKSHAGLPILPVSEFLEILQARGQ